MTTSSTTTSTAAGTALWEELQSIAEEYEDKGWLCKYFNDQGKEIWVLTALGRRKLGYGHLTPEQREEIARKALADARDGTFFQKLREST